MKPLIDPINTSDGKFHGKDKQTGDLATVVTPEYMNNDQDATRSMQREIITILTEADITPEEATDTQLLAALKKILITANDERVKNALQKENNLSDVSDKEEARGNLGIDTALAEKADLTGNVEQKFWVLSAPGDDNAAVPVSLLNSGLAEKADLVTGVLSSSGYIKIPISASGNSSTLILQWGTFSGTTSSSAGADNVYENSSISVTWPITFPTGVLQVITGGSSDVPGAGVQETAWNLVKTNTGATFGVSCRVASASMSGSYIAIGY